MASYSFMEFVNDHKSQLLHAGVPELYWGALHAKLATKLFDAGDFFALAQINYTDPETGEVVDRDWDLTVSAAAGVSCADPTNIYLVDHACTFQLSEVRTMLQASPALVARLLNILSVTDEDLNSVTVDKVAHVTDADRKPYLLLPWVEQDFSEQSSAHDFIFSDAFFAVSLPSFSFFFILSCHSSWLLTIIRLPTPISTLLLCLIFLSSFFLLHAF
ncbi:unnamed protein product [Dibothriocephalus latus]|uniref:Tubulin--tyrosine ligase-like protein 12 SET-like domain-containing protein n=1 Tax=Dibothriocephalus latus TaxID=60516 RepID=A0A3P7P5U8_DIBLA|nr:unnamed protein product [Dibothriocephalus latus]